jgi:hypothetical protein
MITEARIEELKALGYTVEDMGAEHGEEFAGLYRWFHDRSGHFQDSEPSFSNPSAWESADRHAAICLEEPTYAPDLPAIAS